MKEKDKEPELDLLGKGCLALFIVLVAIGIIGMRDPIQQLASIAGILSTLGAGFIVPDPERDGDTTQTLTCYAIGGCVFFCVLVFVPMI